MLIRFFLLALLSVGSLPTFGQAAPAKAKVSPPVTRPANPYYSRTDTAHLHVSDAQWKKVLSPALYEVARNKATERAFTGQYWNTTGKGSYYCAACGNALFRSDAKFASECGWPSFFQTLRPKSVRYQADHTHGMERVEVLCGRCDAHLGHLFNDGPPPSHKRYCMNSISLEFQPDKNGLPGAFGSLQSK
ncbi:peptide-methionine (R)-S-oxide reductase MsrB [Hymenobacter aerilatus]|uniref:peptide-methionine (R)-S-oxide reductase n=1 Tax=Hymenobacter aerilatus TaxID=2932251 RepID=A0A8T9STS7_9BACT|nr:peptide-methionine (R)-S-oxide reductase MsrB [Hymenobacter aerilatus]UOR04123.1 peptide-methionine (R)-S-oxide reductase MsrB [Hymenobacter aerilatus]